jgi:hypothetical protein
MAQHSSTSTVSVAQVAASALAAASSAVAASKLGVAGTVIGAAVGSVVATTGTALYLHSLQRTQERLRLAREATLLRGRAPRETTVVTAAPVDEEQQRVPTALRWRPVSLAASGLFLVVIAGISGFELASGRSVSDRVNGRDGAESTTIGGLIGGDRTAPRPAETRDPSVAPTPPSTTPPTPPSSESPAPPPTGEPSAPPTSPPASPPADETPGPPASTTPPAA